ncbi:MAG: hypothetical protein JOZ27_06490 [Caulobacteraceae bacterium]|nr:hypothetical protein [Caulobacteraceae bacterium]
MPPSETRTMVAVRLTSDQLTILDQARGDQPRGEFLTATAIAALGAPRMVTKPKRPANQPARPIRGYATDGSPIYR